MIDFMKEFRRVYPDRDVFVNRIDEVNESKAIVEASFPDGTFFFVVEGRIVSALYRSYGAALESIKKEEKQ